MQDHIVLKASDNGTVSVTSVVTSLPTPDNDVMRAMIAVETNAVRMCWDGTDPSSSVGYPMAAGTHWIVTDRDLLAAMRFISQSGTATLSVAYMSGG